MKPREFWWLYEWKVRGKKARKGLARSDRNRLLNWMDEANAATP
jgi:hypothetical protein